MANGTTATEVDYTGYATKPPTSLQARFPDWLFEKTGITFGTVKEEKAFREGVRLATALRMEFQASPENREATAKERAERAEAKSAPAEAAPAPAPAKPVKAAKAAKAAKPAPAPAAPAEAAAAPAKPTRGGRRGPRPATTPSADAPF